MKRVCIGCWIKSEHIDLKRDYYEHEIKEFFDKFKSLPSSKYVDFNRFLVEFEYYNKRGYV